MEVATGTGQVRSRQTAQGYSDESVWSRGQAWAVYGYTLCYRYTHDSRYLHQAMNTFRMMKNHPSMPQDLIPYWDMDAPDIPNEPRDVSAASCMASALYELSTIKELPDAHFCRPNHDNTLIQTISCRTRYQRKLSTYAFSRQHTPSVRNRCAAQLCRLLLFRSIETET